MSIELLKALIYNLSRANQNSSSHATDQPLFIQPQSTSTQHTENSVVLHIIFCIGIIGNLFIAIYCYIYINYKSINRSYLISIALCDLIYIIMNYVELYTSQSAQSSYINNNVVCQLNNYLISATKNLSATLLLICLINNAIRLIVYGSYTIGIYTWVGQACSKSSTLFAVLTVLAISYYNLWNKSVFYMANIDEYRCMFVYEFDAQLIYKLENITLLIIYTGIFLLAVYLLVVFQQKKDGLRCHVNRDRKCERDMLFTLILLALFTSIMRWIFLLNTIIQINSSLFNIENILMQTAAGGSGADLLMNIDTLTTQYSSNLSVFQLNIELILFLSSSFKIVVFLVCMGKVRRGLSACLRMKCRLNPRVLMAKSSRRRRRLNRKSLDDDDDNNDGDGDDLFKIEICSFKFDNFNFQQHV